MIDDLFLVDGKQRRISSSITPYSSSNWLCHLCNLDINNIFNKKPYSTKNSSLRTRNNAYNHVKINGFKNIQKLTGWKVNGTAINRSKWIGMTNLQYLIDLDHNGRLNTKSFYKLFLRKMDKNLRASFKSNLNRICPSLNLNLLSNVSNMLDAAMTIKQYEFVALYMPYAAINLVESKYSYFAFAYSDYLSYLLSSMTIPPRSEIFKISDTIRVLALKTFGDEVEKAFDDIGKKKKINKFFKAASFHDLFDEIPRMVDIYGPPCNYRTNILESTMRIPQSIASRHNNRQTELSKVLFNHEMKLHQIIFAIQQIPHDKNGSFNENGKYKGGDAWKNHENAAKCTPFRAADDPNKQVEFFIRDRMNGSGSMTQINRFFIFDNQIHSSKLRWLFCAFFLCALTICIVFVCLYMNCVRNIVEQCWMIFNDELKPNLGFILTSNINVCYKTIVSNNIEIENKIESDDEDNDEDDDELDDIIIEYGIISNIFINTAKDCLSFEIFQYIPFGSSNFCLKNAKRKVFSQSSIATRVDGNRIINECRMIEFIDRHQQKLFVLHPFAGTCFPLNYKGVL